jgi:SAM-dependent methyltransferase
MISDLNKQRFEYIWHLYNENKTAKDLAFRDHVPCDPDVWQFPEHLIEYHKLVFETNRDAFDNTTILDIGCGTAWYMGCMQNAKKYIGADPDEKSIRYARIMASLIDIDAEISFNTAEKIDCTADTIMLLSVTQHLNDLKTVFAKFDCKNIILDSWEQLRGVHLNELVVLLETQGFALTHKLEWDGPNKDGNSTDRGQRYILHFDRPIDRTAVI